METFDIEKGHAKDSPLQQFYRCILDMAVEYHIDVSESHFKVLTRETSDKEDKNLSLENVEILLKLQWV